MRYLFIILATSTLISCSPKVTPTGADWVYDDSVNRQFWTAEWSPDDKFVAIAGVDSTVRIYHAHNLRLYKSFAIPNWIHAVKWNPDGNLLAIATLSEYAQLIDVKANKIIQLNNNLGPTRDPAENGSRAIGWNHTGDLLAVGGLDGIIKIWDKQGTLLNSIDKYKPGTSFVTYLALDWHPSKNIFVAANFEIQLYDGNGKEINVMEHVNKEAIMLCAKWHPSGSFFVIGDYGFTWEGKNVPSLLHFWSSDGQLLKSVSGSKAEYRNIDWNGKGDLLATASDKLRIWTKEGNLLHEGPADGLNYLWGISWNHKGRKIVTSSRYKTIAIWDSTARLLKRIDVE